MSYIYFTEEQKERANHVDLVDFLTKHGEKLFSSGREKRLASDRSITIRGNEWYDHADNEGGQAVSFVRRFYNLEYPDAVTMLLDGEQGQAYQTYRQSKQETPKPFQLPEKSEDMHRVSAYLTKTRCLDRGIVSAFVETGMLYEDAKYHNAVFVGFDSNGTARHAHKRGTCTKGAAYKGNVEGCDPRYSFHFTGQSDTIYVFEAPIDMLSFLTLYPKNWQQHSYVCLCGVAEHALLQMLKEHPDIQNVCLCLDHDAAGIEAAGRLEEILREQSRAEVSSLKPRHKDWNEDLKAARGREALPAEEHPQLLLCAAFFRNLSERGEGKGLGSVHSLLDRGRQAAWLMAGLKLPSSDLREEVTGWCGDMVLQCLALEQKEFLLAGLSAPDNGQWLTELQKKYFPHNNRGSWEEKNKEIRRQLGAIKQQVDKMGEIGNQGHPQLVESYRQLALDCVRLHVKAELGWRKQAELLRIRESAMQSMG